MKFQSLPSSQVKNNKEKWNSVLSPGNKKSKHQSAVNEALLDYWCVEKNIDPRISWWRELVFIGWIFIFSPATGVVFREDRMRGFISLLSVKSLPVLKLTQNFTFQIQNRMRLSRTATGNAWTFKQGTVRAKVCFHKSGYKNEFFYPICIEVKMGGFTYVQM